MPPTINAARLTPGGVLDRDVDGHRLRGGNCGVHYRPLITYLMPIVSITELDHDNIELAAHTHWQD